MCVKVEIKTPASGRADQRYDGDPPGAHGANAEA